VSRLESPARRWPRHPEAGRLAVRQGAPHGTLIKALWRRPESLFVAGHGQTGLGNRLNPYGRPTQMPRALSGRAGPENPVATRVRTAQDARNYVTPCGFSDAIDDERRRPETIPIARRA